MFFIFLFHFLLCQGALSYVHHIHNASDLIQFSRNVSSGKSYSGTTVFLDSDIDFSGGLSNQFEPIGKSNSNNKYFQGIFNGQGHTISNLTIRSSLQCVGLFGYTRATIRNVVLDSSCSVVSSYSGPSYSSTAYVGGIVGQCDDCTIENTVNMASFSFTGKASWNNNGNNLYLGGIAGYIYASNKDVTVRNCASYGSVTHSGTVSSYARIGGIVGYSSGWYSSNKIYVLNCLNYGTINHSGTTSYSLYLGGILGYAWYGTNNIENCVSGGKIISNKGYMGSIVGCIYYSSTTITHCYWSSDVGRSKACGDGYLIIDNETKQVELNATTMDNLNSYNSSWAKWFMLNLNGGNINSLNQASLVVTQKHFPDPAKTGNTFLFWCLDTECNEKYDLKATNITKVTGLYAVWNISTVLLDFGNGTTTTQTVVYRQKYGTLPDASRIGYTFTGWFTEEEEGKGEKVTENDIVTKGFDHTLYAHWTANNYTLTFDYGNGTNTSIKLRFNETIVYPNDLVKRGYTFNGWNPRPDRMPAEDTTVVAQWTANNYTVTLNVNGGDKLPASEFTVTYDKPYNCLPNTSRTGHTFAGWFTDDNGGIEVTNETIANITASNHTLYAHWTANDYTLTFDYGNGTVSNKTLKYNETINYPVNPTREGYTFSGWNPKPEMMPAKDITVVAQWTINNYKITFDYGNETNTSTELTFNDTINYPENLTREGYTFSEWVPRPERMPADDITVVAQWKANKYTITFDYGNGTIDNKTLKFNETIIYPVNLIKEGYTFSEWKPKPEEMPANDITVVAQWIEMSSSISSSHKHENNKSGNASASLIAGLTISIFLLIVCAVLLAVFFILLKMKKNTEEKGETLEYEKPLVKSELKYNRYSRKKGVNSNSDDDSESDSDYEDEDSDSDYEDDYEDSDDEENSGRRRKGVRKFKRRR